MADFDNITPKKIGNFNIPKNVIECKVDTLAFLEILLRKNICTWEEIEEIREIVVMHMNVMFPDLQLSYTTPAPLKDQGPITPPEEPKKPLYYNAPPPEMDSMNVVNQPKEEVKKPMHVNLLYQNVQPPKVMTSFTKGPSGASPKPITNQIPNATSSPRPASQPNTANQQQPATNANAQANPANQQPIAQNNPANQQSAQPMEQQNSVAANQPNEATSPDDTNTPVDQPNLHSQNNAVEQQQQQPEQQNPNNDNLPKGNFSTPANNRTLPGGPRPMMPNAGPPKILNNPPRKKI